MVADTSSLGTRRRPAHARPGPAARLWRRLFPAAPAAPVARGGAVQAVLADARRLRSQLEPAPAQQQPPAALQAPETPQEPSGDQGLLLDRLSRYVDDHTRQL